MASVAVESVVAVFTKFLIEEYAVLAEAGKHVEWIEKELRSMQGLLEQVEQRGDGEQEQALKEWADKLKDVALNAEDVIKTFVIKSVKRRRWGVLYWYDKYKVGKELEKIRKSMRDICQNGMNLNAHVVSVSVETPPPCSSSSNYTTIIVATMKKLDHILSSQNLITGNNNKVIELMEEVEDGLKDLQNIASKLNSTNERETVWLEEVNDVCSYTAEVAGNFIARREKWLQMSSSLGLVRKLLYHDTSLGEFKKQMKYVSTQIGDALGRSLTYGVVVRDMNLTKTQRSTTIPFQNSAVESSIISDLIIFSISYPAEWFVLTYGSNSSSWAVAILIVVISQAYVVAAKRKPIRARKLKTNPKRGAISRLLTSSIFIFTVITSVIFFLSLFISLKLALLFQLSSPFYQVIVWIVKLWKCMDNNLKCVQRDLDLMHAFVRDTTAAAESEQGMMNERQKVWVGQLRVMAQNGRSLVDAAAKGKGGCWSRRTKFSRDVNCLLEEIINISHRKTTYDVADIITQGTTQHELVCSEEQPEPAASSSSYRPVTGLKQEIQLIKQEQELMYALFRDVLDMREIDRRYRIWLEQMQGIANDIGSVIYQYDAKLKHRSILIYIVKYWTRHVISHKINAIKNKIEDASRRRRAYGLGKTIESSASTVHILRGTTQLSLVAKESDVIGLDDDAQVLMAQLLSDERRSCITWIVGIGGTGKTTLAKKIFQDNAVVSHFQCCLWMSLPSNPNLNCMAQQLLEKIAKEAGKQIKGDSSSDPTVLETLAHKKYLIVVDGIEETSQVYLLDTLKEAIPDMSTGSRLLLTARNANAAQHAIGTITFVHHLQLLDDESSWVLFTRHLKVETTPELINIGREIVIKCGGMPSQILKMSRFLSHKEHITHEEWSTELNKDQIQSWSETVNTIKKHLPMYLTRCLFYFGLFLAEFGIPARRLIALLVAEERVHHGEHQEPPEQVAGRYLTELIDQNLVQIAKIKRNGKVKTCRLPYALRQLWWTKANDSIFIKARIAGDSNANPKNSIIRWVTDHLNTDHIWYDHIHGDTESTRNDSAFLRTYYKNVISFLSFDTREGSKPGQEIGYFMKGSISNGCFLLLRVLDLERVYKPKLPKSIAKLSQLRYLGLRWTYLESLPSFISKLLKLQTLDLKHTYIHTLPHSIWDMELRHLFLSETFHSRFPPKKKDHFSCIRFLLPRLRDNFLYDLQTLWGLFIDEETPVKDGLDTLVNITKLGLACQSMSLEPGAMMTQLEAVADWIAKLEHLQSLRLKSRDEKGKPWILHLKSIENNVNLTDMYLLGRLSSSSILSQFPKSLVELTLSHSRLEEDPMQLLKELSNIRILSLFADSYMGQTMFCQSQIFPQLHVLKFWKLQHFEEWIIEPGALPCLRQLEIRSCPHLKMLPYGLKHVIDNTLLELKLTNMPTEINVEARKSHNHPIVKSSLKPISSRIYFHRCTACELLEFIYCGLF